MRKHWNRMAGVVALVMLAGCGSPPPPPDRSEAREDALETALIAEEPTTPAEAAASAEPEAAPSPTPEPTPVPTPTPPPLVVTSVEPSKITLGQGMAVRVLGEGLDRVASVMMQNEEEGVSVNFSAVSSTELLLEGGRLDEALIPDVWNLSLSTADGVSTSVERALTAESP